MRRTSIVSILLTSIAIPACAFFPGKAASNSYPSAPHEICSTAPEPDGAQRGSPVATTESKAPGHIIVDQVTDPRYNAQTFDFTLTGGPDNITREFQLRDDSALAPYDSGRVKSGSYTVTETRAFGWTLTDIILVDPDNGSHCNIGVASAVIDIDPGEEVLVVFKNTKK